MRASAPGKTKTKLDGCDSRNIERKEGNWYAYMYVCIEMSTALPLKQRGISGVQRRHDINVCERTLGSTGETGKAANSGTGCASEVSDGGHGLRSVRGE